VKLEVAAGKKLYASATRDEATDEVIVKVVNGEATPVEVKLDLSALGKANASARVIVLAGANRADENSFTEPKKIFPKEDTLKIATKDFTQTFPANSLTVLRIK
jgi:alpha-N-arabinofuranosidase